MAISDGVSASSAASMPAAMFLAVLLSSIRLALGAAFFRIDALVTDLLSDAFAGSGAFTGAVWARATPVDVQAKMTASVVAWSAEEMVFIRLSKEMAKTIAL